MAVENRLFTSDMCVVTLYKNRPNYTDLDVAAQLINMISIYKGCRLRGATSSNPGRATNERGRNSIPYEIGWSIDIGSVVDPTFPNLMAIYIASGAGPFWAWIWMAPNVLLEGYEQLSFIGRCIISDVELTAAGEDMTQSVSLEIQGDLLNVGLGALPV